MAAQAMEKGMEKGIVRGRLDALKDLRDRGLLDERRYQDEIQRLKNSSDERSD